MLIRKELLGWRSKEGKINDVDTGHGQECKDISETTAALVSIEEEKYAVQIELKAGSVSDPSEERKMQEIVVIKDDIMSSIQHCWTLGIFQRRMKEIRVP